MERYDWYHLDEYRESWIFLVLPFDYASGSRTTDASVTPFWEVAVGNLDEIVYTKAVSVLDPLVTSSAEFYRGLLQELHEFRYRDLLLITRDTETMQRLRTGFLNSNLEAASLRGFTHLPLRDELESNFGNETTNELLADLATPRPLQLQASESSTTNGATRELWVLWSNILRLLPAETILGEEL